MSDLPEFQFESAPDLPGSDRLARIFYALLRPTISRLWDMTVEGAENVPLDGPVIIAPNHLSFSDSVFVPASLPRRVWAVGKGDYLDDWKTKHLFPALGMIPIDRSGGAASQIALDTAAEVLKGGRVFMIYPEGTRSRSGNLHKGRTGAARMAGRCDVPIVPVGHVGTLDIQPPDTFVPKINKPCTVRFGKQMRVEDFGPDDDPRRYRRMTDALMFEISQLSEQTYVNTYAGSADESVAVPVRSAAKMPSPIAVPPGRQAKKSADVERPTTSASPVS